MNFQEKLQSRHQFVDWRKHGYIKKPSNLLTNLYFTSIFNIAFIRLQRILYLNWLHNYRTET